MSWICPWCGTENYRDPVNSRHSVECRSCKEEKISPDELEAQIKPQVDAFSEDLKNARGLMNEARDHIASLNDEISAWQIKYDAAATDVADAKKEIEKLKNLTIYREINREAKTRLDIHQKTLPFEVPA